MKLTGFPRGTRYTPVPNPLLGPLLEAIEDPAELKCTLRALWLLHQSKGKRRFITSGELLSDRVLLNGLKGLGVPSVEAIGRGISKGVERGTFISLSVELSGKQEELYFLNDEAGQRAFAQTEQDGIPKGGIILKQGTVGEPSGPKANIFTLYEENIGMLTPLLAEEMKETETAYPWPWIEEAFKTAVSQNRRSWRYVEATLKRWASEGKGDGESGRHPTKVSLKEYRRRQRLLRNQD